MRFVKGTTAQFGGASGDVFSAICVMQISRFTAGKPSKFPFASDEKSIRQPTTSFVRCCPRKMTNSAFRIVFFVLFSFCPFRFPVLTRGEGYGTLFPVEMLRLWRKRVVFEGGFPV
ncbi:MAG: hypothetical protein Q3Y27_08590 [Clostridia bacterium]|nr:hypothetical protein [Clostridia bacterium]